MYDFGARNYDSALGRFMNMDKFSEVYAGISPYSYTLNNPVLFVDPDGNYVDDSFIYQKDKNGKYKNPALIKAYETFAKSKTGMAFLGNFAEKGQVIAGHEYTESGKYDKKNIDLGFKEQDEDDAANARTDSDVKDKGNGLQINILLSSTGTKVDDYLTSIGHESFTHAEKDAEDFADNKKMDLSSIDKDIVNWVDKAIKNGYPKAWRVNLAHHTQETKSQTLNQKLLPILQHYYKNQNIKKSSIEIKKVINGYAH